MAGVIDFVLAIRQDFNAINARDMERTVMLRTFAWLCPRRGFSRKMNRDLHFRTSHRSEEGSSRVFGSGNTPKGSLPRPSPQSGSLLGEEDVNYLATLDLAEMNGLVLKLQERVDNKREFASRQAHLKKGKESHAAY
jgi:hypothetical protein